MRDFYMWYATSFAWEAEPIFYKIAQMHSEKAIWGSYIIGIAHIFVLH